MSRVVAQAILRLEPDAQFVIFGTKEKYTIRWDSKDITQPTQSELDASIIEVEKLDYQLKRLKEYPIFMSKRVISFPYLSNHFTRVLIVIRNKISRFNTLFELF